MGLFISHVHSSYDYYKTDIHISVLVRYSMMLPMGRDLRYSAGTQWFEVGQPCFRSLSISACTRSWQVLILLSLLYP
jgi:hypothetical protein